MSRITKVLIGVAVLAAVAVGGFFAVRGRTGATTEIGGSLEAHAIPEFVSQDASRWVNGSPTALAAARGGVVFIEGWAPA
jgi:hypothetical protein